ncbi:MAG: NYN domain-containing protein [Clostridium perfringens]|nr:NYN domain-containing protein [Clostridium perfringens]
MRRIFVDGYNVINSWSELNERKKYSYEAARQKLIEMLENYGAYKNCKIFLVFDAHKVVGNLEKQDTVGNITVVFTKDGETADSYIERSVDEIGRKVEVVVVTSDSLEQQTIFQRGAIRMSSIEFHNEVIEAEKIIRKKTEKNNVSSNKNFLSDRIDREIFEKLDKIRKQ